MELKKVSELRQIAKERGLSGFYKLRKESLVALLESGPKKKSITDDEFLSLKNTGESPFVKVAQIGKPGKEGTVYLVTDGKSKYAMKTFRKKKSPNTLEREAYFQYLASKEGISPEIIEYNPQEKYIVMELLNRTLIDVVKEQNDKLTLQQQKQIIELYKKLDKIGIMLNDANPLNIMEKNGTFYMIDYGFAKYCTHKDFKEYTHPNFQLMPLGLLLWMKGKHKTGSWEHIRSQISENVYTSMKISEWP